MPASTVTHLQVDIHPDGVTGDIKHDRCAREGGAVRGQGAGAGVLLLDAADVAFCQHQNPTNVLDAAVPGSGEALSILLQLRNQLQTLK